MRKWRNRTFLTQCRAHHPHSGQCVRLGLHGGLGMLENRRPQASEDRYVSPVGKLNVPTEEQAEVTDVRL